MKKILLFLQFTIILPLLFSCYRNIEYKKWIFLDPKKEITFKSENKYRFKYLGRDDNTFKISIKVIEKNSDKQILAISDIENIENIYMDGIKIDKDKKLLKARKVFVKFQLYIIDFKENMIDIDIEFKNKYQIRGFSFEDTYITSAYNKQGEYKLTDCFYIKKGY